jgi:hypothetical protein
MDWSNRPIPCLALLFSLSTPGSPLSPSAYSGELRPSRVTAVSQRNRRSLIYLTTPLDLLDASSGGCSEPSQWLGFWSPSAAILRHCFGRLQVVVQVWWWPWSAHAGLAQCGCCHGAPRAAATALAGRRSPPQRLQDGVAHATPASPLPFSMVALWAKLTPPL